jgi:hypothetical protein
MLPIWCARHQLPSSSSKFVCHVLTSIWVYLDQLGRVEEKPITGRSLIARINSLFCRLGNLAQNPGKCRVFGCRYRAQRHANASFPCIFPIEQGNGGGFAGDCPLRHLLRDQFSPVPVQLLKSPGTARFGVPTC